MLGGQGAQRFRTSTEDYLARFDHNLLRFIETYGLVVHPVRTTPPPPPHDGTIAWHLRPADGLNSTPVVYIDGSALLTQYGPVVARYAFAIIAFDEDDQLTAVATGVPPNVC